VSALPVREQMNVRNRGWKSEKKILGYTTGAGRIEDSITINNIQRDFFPSSLRWIYSDRVPMIIGKQFPEGSPNHARHQAQLEPIFSNLLEPATILPSYT
jgi:hypothetical protein